MSKKVIIVTVIIILLAIVIGIFGIWQNNSSNKITKQENINNKNVVSDNTESEATTEREEDMKLYVKVNNNDTNTFSLEK